jgi:hypothetical protein
LLRQGASEWGARRFWHAHEAWEEAWHGLRASGEHDAAEFLHGMILTAAALENATRGKEEGFKRQFAEGLHLLHAHEQGAVHMGMHEPSVWLRALAVLYADACRRHEWATWNTSGWMAPTPEVA